MKKEITTIKVSKKSVELLNKLKIHPRQAYEEVILKLILENESRKKRPSNLRARKMFASMRANSRAGRARSRSTEYKSASRTKEVTTIKLSKKTVNILNKLKIHPRQAYEEVILKLIFENEEARKKTRK